MDNKKLYTIIVHSENIAGLLNQVTAVFTRQQLNIESLNVSASSIKGVHRYTITCWCTPALIEKVVKQIEKKMDVIQAHYFTDDEIFGWAMHFWDEPEIEVSNTATNCQVVVNHTVELTEEEKEQARQDAINKLRDEEMAKMRRPKTTEKKTTENNPQIAQPSLFDF